MNHFRYLAYRRVREQLESAETADLAPEERELVRDLAEQMLLMREREADEVEEAAHSAAAALRTLTARGSLPRQAASDLWEEICAAGPDPFVGPPPVFTGPVSTPLRSH